MREIKFRAWDRNAKVMRMVADLALNWEEGPRPTYVHSEGPMGGEMRTLRGYDCIVMQFTGLKDRSGRDVYEGDVLRCTDIISGKEYVSDIQFKESGFWMEMGLGQYLIGSEQGREVIGNIYENPELLGAAA